MDMNVGNPFPTPTQMKFTYFIGGGIIFSIPFVFPSPSDTNNTVTGTSTYFFKVAFNAIIA